MFPMHLTAIVINVKGSSGNLYLVNHYEGISSNIGNLPKSMALNTVKQDEKTGKLTVTDMNPIDFSADGGIWTPCAGMGMMAVIPCCLCM